LNSLRFFSKWSLDLEQSSTFFKMFNSLGNWYIRTIVSNKTIREESKESIILMALHNRYTRNLTWNVLVVCKDGKIFSIFRNLITWKSWSKPLNNVSMIVSFNIDSINVILEEVTMITFRQKFWLAIYAKVNLN